MFASEASNWGSASSGTPRRAPYGDTQILTIKKSDVALQIVYGEVYAPGFPDSQGDIMTRETIQKMAHEFLRKGLVNEIDTEHDQQNNSSYVVESFIARDTDPDFIPGSWVMGVRVPDDIWALVQKGELNGFSLDGRAFTAETEIEIEIPEILKGETLTTQDHHHTFFVKYDTDGNLVSGATGPGPDGHIHSISRGTITDTAEGHAHRFSFVEGVIYAHD